MKLNAAFLMLVLAGSPALAQVTLTTYYVVPPTDGCNGLAAFGPASSMWQAPCAAPYLYVVEPMGCAQGPTPFGQPFWFSGDTIYTNVCATPCTLTTYDSSGSCVILCQLPVSTGTSESVSDPEPALRLEPNPLAIGSPLRITTHGKGPVELTLMDAQGRVLYQSVLTSNSVVIGNAHLGAGLHLLRATWLDGRVTTQRLLVQ